MPGVDKFYCNIACEDDMSEACKLCLEECIAGCECSSGSPQNRFCERLQLDAGECAETGGKWVNFNQNFDSIGTAFLTLIEIATTEGWVDVRGFPTSACRMGVLASRCKLYSSNVFFVLPILKYPYFKLLFLKGNSDRRL